MAAVVWIRIRFILLLQTYEKKAVRTALRTGFWYKICSVYGDVLQMEADGKGYGAIPGYK